MKPLPTLIVALLATLTATCSPALHAAGSGGGGIPSAPVGKAKTPEEIAASAYRSGLKQKSKALKALEHATTAKNDKARARQERKADKAFNNAVTQFKKALEHDPRHYEAANELGYSLRRTGDMQSAVGAYNYALQLKPDFLEAIEYRGQAFVSLGLFEQARKSYLRLYREDQTLAATLMNAMSDWLESRRGEEAALTEPEQAFADWLTERRRLVGFSANPDAQTETADW